MKNNRRIPIGTAGSVRRWMLLAVSLLVLVHATRAGTSDPASDSTQFESTHTSVYEEALLVGTNVILVPVVLALTAVSTVPPSAGILVENGTAYATVGFETGFGRGTAEETGRFADERVMLSFVHVYNRHQQDFLRLEGVKDLPWSFLDRRQLFQLGVSPMAGIFARGADRGYSLGASLRVMIPSMPYFGLFPLHTIGLTYRYNRYFSGGSFSTIALGLSAAIIF